MSGTKKGVLVRILDKEFQIACPKDKEEMLKKSANYLDNKMCHLRKNGRIIGLERIAIMAGLSLAHELIELKETPSDEVNEITDKLEALQAKIDHVLLENTKEHDNIDNDEQEILELPVTSEEQTEL